MYCIYCGEELTHHKHIQDNFFECKNCNVTFEVYQHDAPDDENFEADIIIEGSPEDFTEDGYI